eukprot:361064-Chlamydomonas_euryale.AAC.9
MRAGGCMRHERRAWSVEHVHSSGAVMLTDHVRATQHWRHHDAPGHRQNSHGFAGWSRCAVRLGEGTGIACTSANCAAVAHNFKLQSCMKLTETSDRQQEPTSDHQQTVRVHLLHLCEVKF